MEDTDPEFFGQVALLTEAGRISPLFANKVLEAANDEQVDVLVVEAREIVNEQADQSWV
jgi:hypothetical protein